MNPQQNVYQVGRNGGVLYKKRDYNNELNFQVGIKFNTKFSFY